MWCLILVLFVSAGQAIAAQPITKGLLWKIEKPGVAPSYIFGTMHSEDPRVIQLPPKVRQVFNAADSFTIEVKLDAETVSQTASMMRLAGGQELKTLIGDKLFSKAAKLMAEYGVPEHILNSLKPWAVFVTLSTPKIKTGLFLDKILYMDAQNQGKEIYGLETVKEQLAIFNDLPMEEQIALLRETIENYAKMSKMLEELTQAYLSRDLQRMVELNADFLRQGDQQLSKKLMQRLIYDRNARMVKRMAPQLKQGNAFIAVGALHLAEDKGILNLLREKGYHVSVVY